MNPSASTGTPPHRPSPLDLLRCMRPTQWTKNLVVMAAFFFALGDPVQHLSIYPSLLRAAAATALFCLVSSTVYIANDLRDVEADRHHPTKRFRPIAAGRVLPRQARMLALLLGVAGLGGAWAFRPWLGTGFLAVTVSYLILQTLYTRFLKHVALVDIFIIAAGFVLRAVGGAVALGVDISPWLLLCTFLLALFLALCKRRHEKVAGDVEERATRASLISYDERLLDLLIAITSASTLVCYAIYTLSPDTVSKFGTEYLALTVPFVVFGLFRYLDLVYRHEKGDRPEKILLSDLPIMVNLLLYALCVLAVFFFLRGPAE